MQGNTYKPKMETTIRKKKNTDISLHSLKKSRITKYEHRRISARWPDSGHIYVISLEFWGPNADVSPAKHPQRWGARKESCIRSFVKHAKEPPNANAREGPVKWCVMQNDTEIWYSTFTKCSFQTSKKSLFNTARLCLTVFFINFLIIWYRHTE